MGWLSDAAEWFGDRSDNDACNLPDQPDSMRYTHLVAHCSQHTSAPCCWCLLVQVDRWAAWCLAVALHVLEAADHVGVMQGLKSGEAQLRKGV